MSDDPRERFMRLALDEARRGREGGDQPFGAVIVRDGRVIASAHSLKTSSGDATAHAELLCVGKATRALGEPTLNGGVLYVTCEPCPMCCGAVLNTGIATLVLGARLADLKRLPSGAAFGMFGDYSVEGLAALTGARLHVIGGVLTGECEDLYRSGRLTVNG
jgi:tRNA(adenine34) deaminase